jgi:hypothetical protein
MIGWLLDAVPLWAWAILAAVALLVAWRLLGLRGALAAGGALAGVLTYRAGRKAGGADALSRQKKADEKAVKDHDRIEAETDRMSDADLDDANAPWVRKRQ